MARRPKKDDNTEKFAVGYTRVSRMMENKMSTESQIAEIRKTCDAKGYTLIKIYSDEDLSGSETSKRVQFNQMIDDIAKQRHGKIDIVISYNISRFSRSVEDLNKYVRLLKEEYDCDFKSVQESGIDTSDITGEFLLNVFGAIAQLDRKKLIEVISDSNIHRAEIGGRWTNGGLPPYGYVKEGRTIVPDPITSEHVKRVFHMFVNEKKPLSSIAKRFQAEGLDPNRPDQDVSIYRTDKRLNELDIPVSWNGSKVRRIIDNPVYAGINVTCRRERVLSKNSNKTSHVNANPKDWVFSNNLKILRLDENNFWDSDFEVVGYDVEPLIPWEMYVEAQKIRLKNVKNVAKREKVNYLLTELIYCGLCGRRMHGSVNHRDPKHTYYYYRCNKRHLIDDCEMKNVRCEIVDNYVMTALSDSLILIMINDIVNAENDKIDAVVEEYNSEIRQLEAEKQKSITAIENLLEMVKSSATIDIVKETLAEELNREQQKIKRLENKITRLRLQQESESRTQYDIQGFIETVRTCDFEKMSFELKREFFLKYIDRVVYYDPKHIDIYLKINKTPELLNLSDEQKEKIQWKIDQKSKKRKVYNVANRFLEMVKNLDIMPFEWLWHFLYEPLPLRISRRHKS